MQENELLTVEQAAELVGLSKSRLYQLRSQGRGPKSFLRAGKLRYRREDLDAYLEWERDSTSVGGVQ